MSECRARKSCGKTNVNVSMLGKSMLMVRSFMAIMSSHREHMNGGDVRG